MESLKHFECPVCMEYFQESVFQCPTGHSVCSTCKEKLEICPYCFIAYSNTRNFVLESLLTTMKVECKNDNCKRRVLLKNYAQHANQECLHRSMKCKVSLCKWSDIKLLVNDHIKTMHKPFLVQKYKKVQSHQITLAFIEHKGNIFCVRRYVEDNFICWTAESTTCDSVNNTYLVVKMIAATGGCYTLRQPVSNYMEDSEKAKESSIACMLKTKAKGCELLLSIEDENNVNGTG